MKFLVFGAGLMGRAAAYDLARGADVEEVVLADQDGELAQAMAAKASDEGAASVRGVSLNVKDTASVRDLLTDIDSCLSAVPYMFNLSLAEAAVATRTHFCDLGGNNAVVDATLALNEQAQAAGVSLVPDCGLAPGQVAVIARAQIDALDEVESLGIRVGGLPLNPQGTLRYQKFFSINGLINEYVEPVRALRDGELVLLEPLSEIESLEFPAPFGELEAFTTSGGTSTLVETYQGKVQNLDYKTIRYPGHAAILRSLYEMGFFSQESRQVGGASVKPRDLSHDLLEANLPQEGKDVVLVRVESTGTRDNSRLRLRHQGIYQENAAGHTAMMQTTAYSAAIICRMMADGRIPPGGARPQERCVPTADFLQELTHRGIGLNYQEEEL
jgi:lysine 6-dehydrogenase